MNINSQQNPGTAGAVAVPVGTVAADMAAPQVATPFDLNGTYKDNGSARPRITVSGDVLTVDLSSQNRPPATGLLFDDHTILVIFPDVSAWFRGTLVSPGTILWSNSTIWQKLPYVPGVIGDPQQDANDALKAAGFTVKTHQQRPICSGTDWSVIRQTPKGGTQADPGSRVIITVSNC